MWSKMTENPTLLAENVLRKNKPVIFGTKTKLRQTPFGCKTAAATLRSNKLLRKMFPRDASDNTTDKILQVKGRPRQRR